MAGGFPVGPKPAVLVCQESDIRDPEIVELCATIVQTQLEEIDQMEDILERLDR